MSPSPDSHPPAGFWDSPPAVTRLRSLIGRYNAETVDPPRPDQLRKDLQAKLIALNPADRELTPGERDGLRGLLHSLVKLLRLWKQEMEIRHGTDFWQRAEKLFAKDGRMTAWLDFVQRICVSHTSDAVDGLEALGVTGLSWPIPGGRVKTERQPDFGFNFIHITTHRMESRLTADHPAAASASTIAGIRNVRPIVTVKSQGNQLLLFYQDRQGRQVRGQSKNFLLLFSHDPERKVKDDIVWEAIWPEIPFQLDEKGGAHPKLRDLQRRSNGLLVRELGEPPDKSGWIRRLEGYGFALNASVGWRFRLFETDRSAIDPRDPSWLNDRESSGR